MICRFGFVIGLLSLVAFCRSTLAQEVNLAGEWARLKVNTPRTYLCGQVATAPTIDGKLEEPEWSAAAWTEDFVDIEGSLKPLPKHRARAKMLWDATHFYIAAELTEPHVWGTLTQHDAVIFQDNDFEVFLDPNSDNHEYYEFEINALNTSWDLFLPKPYKDGGSADNGWEIPGLKTAVHIKGTLNDPRDQDEGWSLEIAIPWSAINRHAGSGKAPARGEKWRVGFSRVEWQHQVVDGKYAKIPGTKEDNWIWSPQGIIDMHRPERWGWVEFTTEAPSEKQSKLDASMVYRDALMEIYHRQRVFQKANQKWAATLAELGLESGKAGIPTGTATTLTADGFEASFKSDAESGAPVVWHVRQDSRIWQTSANSEVEKAIQKSGENSGELRKAIATIATEHREGLEFLIANMPDRDLQSLTAAFLVEDVSLAYDAWNASPWKADVPKDIFFNNVLPYVSINERRDAWRADFRRRFLPIVQNAKSTTEAAALLNQKLFPMVNVRYSTQRPKADQSPYESIKAGTASCTGLSVLLIDACRSVGVPARFVGTPLWSDNSGNHSWIEVWDKGWHFTGAAEPTGLDLDKAWFIDRASTAKRDDRRNAIYAVSFQRTPLRFPLVWDRSIDYIHAVNVTDRYTNRGSKLPEGHGRLMIRVIDRASGKRVEAKVLVKKTSGEQVSEGQSKDERFDANDHLVVPLALGSPIEVEIQVGDKKLSSTHQFERNDQLLTFTIE